MDLSTAEGAQAALETVDGVLETLGSARSEAGSLRNSLASQVTGLRDTLVQVQASGSAVMDVDIAEETMNLKRMEGLRRAGLFALSQSRTRTDAIASLLS
jgi:flagellin